MTSRIGVVRFDGDTSMFVLIVISIIILVLETTIARLYIFLAPGPQSLQFNILLFIVGIVIFLISHLLILLNIRKRIQVLFGGRPHRLKFIFAFVTIVQFILSAMLILVLIEILSNSSYKTSLIITIVTVSYLSGIINLFILAERFVRWMLRNRSYISVLFGLSTISILVNTLFTVTFVVGVLITQPNEIRWHLGILSPIYTDILNVFQSLYSVSFIISYIITWFATVMVLYTHSHRLGRAKFWALVFLPLLYIVAEFQPIILPLLTEYRSADPVNFTIIYTLIFSMFKIAGAFFFGIGFWFMARKIEQKSLRSFLNISAYGLILVFVTNQASLLLNALFPPLGLMTTCFVGLSSFLLLVGTYSAAVSVSNDVRIRKAIRTSVENESELIGDIGDAELDLELRAKVSSMMDKLSTRLREDTEVESSLTEEDIKDYTNQVIQEVIRRKMPK
jgi:hypothetical protein